MAPRLRSAVLRFDALPEPALRVIFLALPVDARARAACVCRGWRAFLADASLWQVLDLTPAGGVVAERVTENLVRGAVARAAGRLRVFSLNRVRALHVRELLLDVSEADGAELQLVNTNTALGVADLHVVFAAAPRLQVLSAGVIGQCMALLPVLRNEPPYGPVRVSSLDVGFENQEEDAHLLALAAAVASHEPLKELRLEEARSALGVNALVDAVAKSQSSSFSVLTIEDCGFDAETVPALARLLQRGSLTKLSVICPDFPHAQEESLPPLCAALRACPTLTHLSLSVNPPESTNRRAFAELIDAAASLPGLSVLDLRWSWVQDAPAAGHALGALLGANLPSLRILILFRCELGDRGLALVLDGLAANTHLRELDCRGNFLSEAFERDRLRPALAALAARANA